MMKHQKNLTKTEKVIQQFKKKNRRHKAKFMGTMINPQRFHRSQIKFFLLMAPMIIVTILPIIYITSHAFKPLDELYAYPPKIFASRLTLDNFRNLFINLLRWVL